MSTSRVRQVSRFSCRLQHNRLIGGFLCSMLVLAAACFCAQQAPAAKEGEETPAVILTYFKKLGVTYSYLVQTEQIRPAGNQHKDPAKHKPVSDRYVRLVTVTPVLCEGGIVHVKKLERSLSREGFSLGDGVGAPSSYRCPRHLNREATTSHFDILHNGWGAIGKQEWGEMPKRWPKAWKRLQKRTGKDKPSRRASIQVIDPRTLTQFPGMALWPQLPPDPVRLGQSWTVKVPCLTWADGFYENIKAEFVLDGSAELVDESTFEERTRLGRTRKWSAYRIRWKCDGKTPAESREPGLSFTFSGNSVFLPDYGVVAWSEQSLVFYRDGQFEKERVLSLRLVDYEGASGEQPTQQEEEPAKRDRIGVLIGRLRSYVPSLRKTSIRTLAELGDKRAVEPLIACLKHDDPDTREVAAKALGNLGDERAVQPLITVMKADPDASVRQQAAEALGKLGSKRAVEPLIAALQDDKDRFVRHAAARALGRIGDDRAIEPLRKALCDWYMYHAAWLAVKEHPWQPEEPRDIVHWHAAGLDREWLLKNWKQAKRVLLADIRSKDPHKVENGVYVLMLLGQEEVLPDLKRALREKGNRRIAQAFYESKHEDLVEAAKEWAREHGVSLVPEDQNWTPIWGKFFEDYEDPSGEEPIQQKEELEEARPKEEDLGPPPEPTLEELMRRSRERQQQATPE